MAVENPCFRAATPWHGYVESQCLPSICPMTEVPHHEKVALTQNFFQVQHSQYWLAACMSVQRF